MGAGVIRFGVFQLNLSSKELRKHGVPLRLSGHALAILTILLQKPGEIVTREEIQTRLWHADTFVDFQHGLNSAMKKLRGVLGDSAENPRYIETIPRLGYRFIAPVQESASSDPSSEPSITSVVTAAPAASDLSSLPAAPPSTVSPSMPPSILKGDVAAKASAEVSSMPAPHAMPFRRLRPWIVALVAAAILIAVPRILVLAARSPQIVNVQALTNTSRIESFGEIETDGARLFFLERKGHKWNLMQMPTSGGEAQPFSSAFENTKVLAVSPDASEMIVSPFTRRETLLPIFLMPSVGGAPRAIANISATDAAFTPDGQEITYATADGIFQVRRDGTNQRLLATLTGEKTDLDWSPDGRTLRFTRGVADADPLRDNSELWELDSMSSIPHPVLPGWDAEPMQCCGKWTRDGKYFAFISHNHGGAPHVWMLARRGRLALKAPQPTVLSSGPVPFNKLLSSRDGHHLFALGPNSRTEYVAADRGTFGAHPLLGGSSGAWITLPAQTDWTVTHRADGGLWRSHLDGSEPALLVPASLRPTLPSISADGKEVVFDGDPENSHNSRIYVVGTEGRAPQVLVSRGVSVEVPQLTLDRSAVLYAAQDLPSDSYSLHLFDRKSGADKLIAGSAGMRITRWSPDGKYLAAVADDNARISVLDWRTQRWTQIAQGKVFSPPVWAPDSRSLYYQDVLESEEPIHQVSLEGQPLHTFPVCGGLLVGNVLRCGFEAMAPDGSFILRLMRGDHDLFSLELQLP